MTQIDIFGANFKPCGANCGPSLSEEQLTESVRSGLAQRYGDQVQVSYHSLLGGKLSDESEALLAKARQHGVPLPVVMVDGAILQGGGIDYRTILNAVELKFEVGQQAS